jgi:hypothetical protein
VSNLLGEQSSHLLQRPGKMLILRAHTERKASPNWLGSLATVKLLMHKVLEKVLEKVGTFWRKFWRKLGRLCLSLGRGRVRQVSANGLYHNILACWPSLRGGDLVEQRRIVSSGLHGKQRKWYWPWVRSQLASSFWLTSSNPSRMFTCSLLRFRVIFRFLSRRAAPFHIFAIANDLCTCFNQSIVKSLHLMMYPLVRSSLSIGRCPIWLPISRTHPSRTPCGTT